MSHLDDIKARLDRGVLPSEAEARWLVGELELARTLAGRVTAAALDFARTVATATERSSDRAVRVRMGVEEALERPWAAWEDPDGS